jgi:uncharacterized protein YkwD
MAKKKISFSPVLLLGAALILTACGGGGSNTDTTSTSGAGAPTSTPTPAPVVQTAPDCPIGNYKSEATAAINSFRASPQFCGAFVNSAGVAIAAQTYPAVMALSWNSQLGIAADVHSIDMAVNNFFAHQSPTTGKTFRERQLDAGYNWTSGGENIAAGQTSVGQVMADWIASPSHCANMMTAAFREVGVSCKMNPSSTYQFYWTLEMGAR